MWVVGQTNNAVFNIGYVDKDDELAVTEAIDAILEKQQVDTENFTPQQWGSVFWDPLNARPDKIASELNQIFTRVRLKIFPINKSTLRTNFIHLWRIIF